MKKISFIITLTTISIYSIQGLHLQAAEQYSTTSERLSRALKENRYIAFDQGVRHFLNTDGQSEDNQNGLVLLPDESREAIRDSQGNFFKFLDHFLQYDPYYHDIAYEIIYNQCYYGKNWYHPDKGRRNVSFCCFS